MTAVLALSGRTAIPPEHIIRAHLIGCQDLSLSKMRPQVGRPDPAVPRVRHLESPSPPRGTEGRGIL